MMGFNSLSARDNVQAKYLASIKKFSLSGWIITNRLVRERQLLEIINKEIENLRPLFILAM
jgi:hypothetical protein